jgi:hypothetical protein
MWWYLRCSDTTACCNNMITCMCACEYLPVPSCTTARLPHTHIRAHIYIYIYVYVYIYIYINIYIYIHTHIHTYMYICIYVVYTNIFHTYISIYTYYIWSQRHTQRCKMRTTMQIRVPNIHTKYIYTFVHTDIWPQRQAHKIANARTVVWVPNIGPRNAGVVSLLRRRCEEIPRSTHTHWPQRMLVRTVTRAC